MKIMDRIETLNYIKNMISNKKRLIVSRYSDGEYLMMNNQKNNTHDSFDILPFLLKKSIKVKNQLVCINNLKPHNIQDRWCKVQQFLCETGKQKMYGGANWNTFDFQNNNEVLAYLFKGKTLILTRYIKEAQKAFNAYSKIKIYVTPTKNASHKYTKMKYDLYKLCESFDNIIFSCGPIGKILITDLIDKCNSNLIDMGAVINAILNPYSNKQIINQWTMSWVNNVNIQQKSNEFFLKLGNIYNG